MIDTVHLFYLTLILMPRFSKISVGRYALPIFASPKLVSSLKLIYFMYSNLQLIKHFQQVFTSREIFYMFPITLLSHSRRVNYSLQVVTSREMRLYWTTIVCETINCLSEKQ